ncbi:hypothetical protein PACILC2_22430 [Paenibacillus cisolokensis]|uniref:NAD-dependent DNA ligase adenylation domain-containing protein n=1 Tax=Paenibacillus cisolokensis TaxID=1658519 RepID=A0ABQ4N631_9BACL|nr:hypothetical protein [Paenibacillus cisolokensis]GIQ63675.1 hypothetical protein PACILC2_22430 [Paenibacillus cisolokensis]
MNQTITERITYLRRKLYVHSVIYYRYCTSIISDATYDKWAYELADLQRQYPDEAGKAEFAAEFANWDGTTGFDLPWNPWAERTAARLIKIHEGGRE